MTRVTKVVDFSAAHSIKDADKCANKHGHNWKATITVDQIAGLLDERGFVIDVRELKETAFKYDHDDLDKYFEYASTENVAQQIANDSLELCKASNPEAVYIVNVLLEETANNSANVSCSNFEVGLPGPPEASLSEQMARAQQEETNYQFGGTQTPIKKASFVKRVK